MEYAHLGRTGLKVSRLGLGAMNFGMLVEEDDAHAVMDAAFDAGINYIDTADVYGTDQSPDMAQGNGLSEEIVGRWLQRSGHRDEVVIATKVYQPMGLGPNDKYLSAYHIRRACEASLRRLQTDHIDLYQMHHIDRNTPWTEIWQAMEQLIREGKITYVGSSNFAGWHIATAQSEAQARGLLGLASEQSLYNLTARAVEMEVVPAMEHFGIGMVPWSPLAGGLLGGVLDGATGPRREGKGTGAVPEQIERLRPQLEAYEALCHEIGERPADVALAWLLSRSVVSACITGPRTTQQLQQNLRAVDVTLDDDTLAELDRIWPGPGESPEMYSW